MSDDESKMKVAGHPPAGKCTELNSQFNQQF